MECLYAVVWASKNPDGGMSGKTKLEIELDDAQGTSSIAFKIGVIYALNKIRENIADGKSLHEIEKELDHLQEKTFHSLGRLL